MMKLHQGDCLEVMKQIPDGSVDLILTDPPYELNLHGGRVSSGDFNRDLTNKKHINFIAEGFNFESVFNEFLRVCKIPNILIFCSNKQISKTMKFFEDKKIPTTLLVWKKTNPIPLCNLKHISDCEFIVYVRGKKAPFDNSVDSKMKHKVKIFPTLSGKNRNHPTEKPVNLLSELIYLHSFEKQTILDPFMGSGSTGVASKQLNRKFIGIELDEQYFKIAENRINGELL